MSARRVGRKRNREEPGNESNHKIQVIINPGGRGKRPLRVSRALRHGTGAPAPTSPFPCKALHVPTEERHRPAGSGRVPPGNKTHELGRRRPSRGTQRSSPGGSAAVKLIPLVTQRPAAETTHAGQKRARSPVLVTHLPAGFPVRPPPSSRCRQLCSTGEGKVWRGN